MSPPPSGVPLAVGLVVTTAAHAEHLWQKTRKRGTGKRNVFAPKNGWEYKLGHFSSNRNVGINYFLGGFSGRMERCPFFSAAFPLYAPPKFAPDVFFRFFADAPETRNNILTMRRITDLFYICAEAVALLCPQTNLSESLFEEWFLPNLLCLLQ